MILSRHDILAWFELLELDVSGDYKAVPVEHGPERSRGMFLLHHGVQRKVALTITHESSAHLKWAEVCEVVVGRVRAREDGQSGMGDMPLSLPVTTSMCSQFGGDRTCYRNGSNAKSHFYLIFEIFLQMWILKL